MKSIQATFMIGYIVLTCSAGVAGVAGVHVEAVVLMGVVVLRVCGDVDASDRLLHPVRVPKMEAALKAALVF